MVWRGGERFERCLQSIAQSRHNFKRILLSVTSSEDSPDMKLAHQFASLHPGIEVICTKQELPTMKHQAMWVDYLQATGVMPSDWIFWLAYDDEVRASGIERLIDSEGNWPLEWGTAYLGPWALRHEGPDELFAGPFDAPLESWTSFPLAGPQRLPVMDWLGQQLEQPTYLQMSGAVVPFTCFLSLRNNRPRKAGPMRIEMATALAPPNTVIQEFPEPVTIIYGRSNSDRASYGSAARREDVHLVGWLLRHHGAHPSRWPALVRLGWSAAISIVNVRVKGAKAPEEEWRVRAIVTP